MVIYKKRTFKIDNYYTINICFKLNKFDNINNTHILLDTNAILYILKRFKSFEHILSIKKKYFCILLNIVDEVIEHHRMSLIKDRNKVKGNIINHMENFKKIIKKDCVIICEIAEKEALKYRKFQKDSYLHYAMKDLNFKILCSQDSELISLFGPKVILHENLFKT